MQLLEPILINFVSIGKWNKSLFTGSWVSTNLFGLSKGEKFNALVSPDDLQFIFQHKGISFIPTESAIDIKVDEYNDIEKKVKLMNSIATKLFLLLPHTPIKASGFNVKYHIENNLVGNDYIKGIKSKISQLTSSNLESIGFKEIKNNHILNTIITNIDKEGSFDLTFNFHFDDKQVISNNSFNDNRSYANQLVNVQK